MSELNLTSCQQRAFDTVMNTDGHLTISGPAGSGKTFLMQAIMDELKHKNVCLTAPTHQAKNVLHRMTGKDVSTIHSLLHIHPDTYEDVRKFAQAKTPELDDVDILIVDEASMIDSDLYKIMGDSIPRKCRIIGVGDKYQIQPVRHAPGVLSPMFTKFDMVEMNEVVRQAADNPIIQVATDIRNGGWFKTNWSKELKQGVMNVQNVNRMLDVYLSKLKTPDDLMDYRLLCYTNACVKSFNDIIRSEVYQADDPFIVGEYLVTQQPVMQSDGKYMQCVIDNGAIVKIKDIEQIEYEASLPKMHNESFDIAKLSVEDESGSVYTMNVLWDNANEKRFQDYLSAAAGEYKNTFGNTKRYWKAFWGLKDSMIDTKSLGAGTVHKSQGSTVKGVCIYTQDFGYAEPEIIQQLAYVGVTRPTDWCLYN